MSLPIQVDPFSAAAAVAAPVVPPLIDFVKSIVYSSEIDIQQLHKLSLSVAHIEQQLDKMDYAQLRDTFPIVKPLKCSCYEAEDMLDEVLIDCCEKSGVPTKSVYNQVFNYPYPSESITSEILGGGRSNSVIMNTENCPSAYSQLPRPMKKCFELFAIFLGDYKFEKENLVHLWMAEDYIRDDGKNKKLEDIGSIYFDEFVEKSFLSKPANGPENFYKIDGDLHEFAKSVSCGTCVTINETDPIIDLSHLFDSLRHISLHRKNYSSETIKILAECIRLRTFFLHLRDRGGNPNVKLPDDPIKSFRRLRVLDLSCPSIIEIPESIGGLKHLRYLNLSKSSIQMLPKTICDLHSLQILKLHGCRNLKNLPCLGDLRSLKKFLSDKRTPLDSYPPGIGKLTMLETFSGPFVVGKHEGEIIGELKNMINLRGSLCISKLENVLNKEEAEEAKVNDKELLSELKLMWTIAPSGEQGRLKHQEVLEVLQPPNNLITLKLLGYGGVRFPHEMVNESFKNLEKVSLKNCNGCEKLPALWSLPILKTLCIRGMDEIEQLNSESFLESGIRIGRRLPSLETLKVEEMSNLRSCDATTFPRLNQLTIKKCPMLEEIQELQMLDSQCRLTIKECPLLTEWMDNQQPGWQKEVQDDGSLIYQKIEQA